ncbi:NPCBM/NEW2 domain-containing protein [Atopobiaceae bacterium 24-176]
MNTQSSRRFRRWAVGLALVGTVVVSQPAQALPLSATDQTQATGAQALSGALRAARPQAAPSARAAADVTYLSDMTPEFSHVGWNTLTFDKTPDGGKLTLKIDGSNKEFDKGIYAHAESTIVYNVGGLGRERFQSWVGLNQQSNPSSSDGVVFKVYTQAPGSTEWVCAYNPSGMVTTPSQNAAHVSVDITGVEKIKLEVGMNHGKGCDWSVWAGAKLTAADYDDPADVDLAALDAQIRARSTTEGWADKISAGTLPADAELLLLDRAFIAQMGTDALRSYAAESPENCAVLETVMGDVKLMRHWFMGGTPVGRPIESLKVLRQLWDLNKADIADTNPDADVYRRLMVATSLVFSSPVKYWTGSAPAATASGRYYAFKTLRENADTYKFQKSLFDRQPVETMRWLVDNKMNDVQLPWLLNYSLSKYPDNERLRLDSYTYIEYNSDHTSNGQYDHTSFYNPAYYDGPVTDLKGNVWPGGWNEKYLLRYDDPHFPAMKPGDQYYVPYGQDHLKQHQPWMVFEKGGVCGSIAKTASNLDALVGQASAGAGQPGHAVALFMSDGTFNGKHVGMWGIQNDISGWTGSEKGERLLCGWGAKSLSTDPYNCSYVLLGQAVLDDYDNYVKSQELLLLAKAAPSATEDLLSRAVQIQPTNYNVWESLLAYTKDKGSDVNGWNRLADAAGAGLAHYPLPMKDMLTRIQRAADRPEVTNHVSVQIIDRLTAASTVADTEMVQANICRIMANYLMGKGDSSVVNFSFSGPDAGVIKLADRFTPDSLDWDWSIDGGTTWHNVHNETSVRLTNDQVDQVRPSTDIKVRITGSSAVHTLDITQAAVPAKNRYWVNDDENRILGLNGDTHEVSLDGGVTWAKLADAGLFNGNCTVKLRVATHGTERFSDAVDVAFTANSDDPADRYIPLAEWSVVGASSQLDPPANVHDGNGWTMWHSDKDEKKAIMLDLGHDRDLVALSLLPRQTGGGNGIPRKLKVYVADAGADGAVDPSTWKCVLEQDTNASQWMGPEKRAAKRFAVPDGTRGRFVALQEVSDHPFFSLAGVSFYENAKAAVPDQPDTPNGPDNPDGPANPDVPVVPDNPNLPTNPDVPTNPDTPVVPDAPEPDKPASPQAPQIVCASSAIRTFTGAPLALDALDLAACRGEADATGDLVVEHRSGNGGWVAGLPKDAGTYEVRATLPAAVQDGVEYSGAQATASFVVEPAPVVVRVEGAASRRVGDAAPLRASYQDVFGTVQEARPMVGDEEATPRHLASLGDGTYAVDALIDDPNYVKDGPVQGVTSLTVSAWPAAAEEVPAEEAVAGKSATEEPAVVSVVSAEESAPADEAVAADAASDGAAPVETPETVADEASPKAALADGEPSGTPSESHGVDARWVVAASIGVLSVVPLLIARVLKRR